MERNPYSTWDLQQCLALIRQLEVDLQAICDRLIFLHYRVTELRPPRLRRLFDDDSSDTDGRSD